MSPDLWLAEVVERSWERMVRAGMAAGWDRPSAEGIAQDAALEALVMVRRKPALMTEVERPVAWLVGIARMVGRGRRRKEQRRARIFKENEWEIIEALFPESHFGGALDAMREQVLATAKRVLDGRQLEVIRAMLEDDMNDREIGEALGISHRTVRVHRRNALMALLKHMFPRGGGSH